MKLEEKISNWLDKYLTDNNLESFIIGVSGGIDSAVTSTLCAMTGKPTIVLSMPIHQSKLQLNRANNHLKWLKSKYPNVRVLEFDLTQLFETFKLLFTEEDNLALANTRSRLRMVTLYQVATMNKGIVAGTGNKVEDFGVGFYTKYGDGGVDISPIADLYKSEVKELARDIGINFEIIEAAPTDGLWEDNRTDEDQIGATYEELEWAMEYKSGNPITNRQKLVLKIYNKFNTQNKHKMVEIPIFKK
jgi:NAD+ synthase